MGLRLVALLAWSVAGVRGGDGGECDDGITCRTLAANDLTFSCRFAGNGTAGRVVLLHGFPEWSAMFAPLMRDLAGRGYASVACNQRGYSPGARPDGVASYRYRLLAGDAVAVADAAFGENATFHLVGHDHGAVLGWVVAGAHPTRLESYSALSIPHPDAFSAGLYGDRADLPQQLTSQYFTVFSRSDSASEDFGLLYHTMSNADPTPAMGALDDEEAFQRALWWYAGANADGIMAMPPTFGEAYLLEHGAWASAALRAAFPAEDNAGTPQRNPTGNVTVPTLFACGVDDASVLCDRPFSRDTAAYVTADYAYLAVDCGHDLLACDDDAQTRRVVDAVLARVAKV